MNARAPRKANSPQAEIAVIDAAHTFAAASRPDDADKRAIETLIIESLPYLDRHALKQVASALAPTPHTPPGLASALASLDISICSTFIASSPVMNDQALLDIIRYGGIEHSRAVARRSFLSAKVSTALRDLFDERVDRALDLRQRPTRYLTRDHAPDQDFDVNHTAQNIHACSGTEVLDLIELAQAGHQRAVATFVSEKLGISLESTDLLLKNVRSGNLLHGLRAMELADDEAWSLYEAIARDVANENGLEDRFRKAFSNLQLDTSLKIVRGWRMDDILERCLDVPDMGGDKETAA